MRIVAFGDIHMALPSIARLAPELRAADLVILAGDLTNFGGRQDAAQVLQATRQHAATVLAVPGNLDRADVFDLLHEAGSALHGVARRFGDLGVFGCGGSNPTPFRTPTELSEEEISRVLERAHAGVADAPRRLMVCHAPPARTCTDRVGGGAHVGSTAARTFIETYQPDVCITGHIHESPGVDHLGRTCIVNPGALRDGGYVVVCDAPAGMTAELRRL